MATSQFPPAQDPEKIPTPTLEEPDYNEPVEDPDSGELPLGDPQTTMRTKSSTTSH